jgi:hypothetical protein
MVFLLTFTTAISSPTCLPIFALHFEPGEGSLDTTFNVDYFPGTICIELIA